MGAMWGTFPLDVYRWQQDAETRSVSTGVDAVQPLHESHMTRRVGSGRASALAASAGLLPRVK